MSRGMRQAALPHSTQQHQTRADGCRAFPTRASRPQQPLTSSRGCCGAVAPGGRR